MSAEFFLLKFLAIYLFWSEKKDLKKKEKTENLNWNAFK